MTEPCNHIHPYTNTIIDAKRIINADGGRDMLVLTLCFNCNQFVTQEHSIDMAEDHHFQSLI